MQLLNKVVNDRLICQEARLEFSTANQSNIEFRLSMFKLNVTPIHPNATVVVDILDH